MHVKGSVAVITGGARGLGKAFSEALLSRGGKVSNFLSIIALSLYLYKVNGHMSRGDYSDMEVIVSGTTKRIRVVNYFL